MANMSLWIRFIFFGLLVSQGSNAIDLFRARADFLSATSAYVLGVNNMARYPSYWSDVMFYAPYRGFEFHCFTVTGNVISQMRTDGRNKLAVFGYRGESANWDAGTISQILANSGLGAPDSRDERAAETIYREVKDTLRSRGYAPSAVIVYFVGDEFPEEGTFIHTDSPVATHTVWGVELVYCHTSGWECFWRGFSRVSGKYKIYVYP